MYLPSSRVSTAVQFPPLPCPQAKPGQVLPITFSLLLCSLPPTSPNLTFLSTCTCTSTFPDLSRRTLFFLLLHTPVPTIITSEYPPDRRFSHSCLRTEPLRKLRLSFIDSSPTLRKSYPISDYILVAINQGQATIEYRCSNMEMGNGRINEVMDDAPLDPFVPIAMTFA